MTATAPTTSGRSSRLAVTLGGLSLANPVMPASGCFGPELAQVVPLRRLGAVVTKTVFADIRSGNPSHRLTETASGVLNAVGIPSPGLDHFIDHVLPRYQKIGCPVIVSIGGLNVGEYWRVAEQLERTHFAALEVNVSCPNLEHGGLEIGTDPKLVEAVVTGVVSRTRRPVIVKLTPNVTRIADIARAAETAGATALTVANTFVGMSIDIQRRRPVLGNGTGGLSGPAIKPLVLRLVWETTRAVRLPVIGCGGIACTLDVIEFLLAGASAVQVGTANFAHPDTMTRLLDELPAHIDALGISNIADAIGTARSWTGPNETVANLAGNADGPCGW